MWLRQINLFLVVLCTVYSFADQVKMNYYHFDDKNDNEVNTSGFNVLKTIWQGTQILLDVELDQVTSAPIVDGESGATRPAIKKKETLQKNRGQFIIGVLQDLNENHQLGLNTYLSREMDYRSNSFSGNYTAKLLQENLIVNLGTQYNLDRVGYLEENYDFSEETKEVWMVKGKISQLLSTTMVYTLQGDFTLMDGFLSDPYRRVRLWDGSRVAEKIPSIRKRYSVGNSIKWGLEKAVFSIQFSHRYYWDRWTRDNVWGVSSNTYRVVLAKGVGDYLKVDLSYRNYAQTGAYFWQESYSGDEEFMTADYKLSTFDSQNFGFGTVLNLGLFGEAPDLVFLNDWNVSFDYFRYLNSLDFEADIFEVALNILF